MRIWSKASFARTNICDFFYAEMVKRRHFLIFYIVLYITYRAVSITSFRDAVIPKTAAILVYSLAIEMYGAVNKIGFVLGGQRCGGIISLKYWRVLNLAMCVISAYALSISARHLRF